MQRQSFRVTVETHSCQVESLSSVPGTKMTNTCPIVSMEDRSAVHESITGQPSDVSASSCPFQENNSIKNRIGSISRSIVRHQGMKRPRE